MKKLKFVSMGVNSNAPVKGSIFMDRFLLVKGFVKKIFKLGFDRVGFVIEKFADKYEDGKFSGGFLSAQLERGKRNIIPPHYWGKSDLKTPKGCQHTSAGTGSTPYSATPPTFLTSYQKIRLSAQKFSTTTKGLPKSIPRAYQTKSKSAKKP